MRIVLLHTHSSPQLCTRWVLPSKGTFWPCDDPGGPRSSRLNIWQEKHPAPHPVGCPNPCPPLSFMATSQPLNLTQGGQCFSTPFYTHWPGMPVHTHKHHKKYVYWRKQHPLQEPLGAGEGNAIGKGNPFFSFQPPPYPQPDPPPPPIWPLFIDRLNPFSIILSSQTQSMCSLPLSDSVKSALLWRRGHSSITPHFLPLFNAFSMGLPSPEPIRL